MFCRALGVNAGSPGEPAKNPAGLSPFTADATYRVYMPQSAEPVAYKIEMMEYGPAMPADSLSPCNYLISWRLYAPGVDPDAGDSKAVSSGFSAYFNGNHYRYDSGVGRIREYHSGTDDASLAPELYGASRGVQQTVMFAGLLPAFLSARLAAMRHNPAFICQVDSDAEQVRVKGVERASGYDVMEYDYKFNRGQQGVTPRSITLVTSPATISEQTVEAVYTYPGTFAAACDSLVPLTEEKLMAMWPREFSSRRCSTYRIDNLPGEPLPSFTSPTRSGARYEYRRGENFNSPVIVVFVDPQAGEAQRVVADVRAAVASLPFATEVFWAIASNHPATIDSLLGDTGVIPGEVALTGVRALSRDCGVTAWPSIVFCNRHGVVKDVQVGDNNQLSEIVIQKTALCD